MLVLIMLLFFGYTYPNQVAKNLRQHYRLAGVEADFHEDLDAVLSLDYWRHDTEWRLPSELVLHPLFQHFHSYMNQQVRWLKDYLEPQPYYKVARMQDTICDRLSLYFSHHQETINLLELHKVKMITINLNGIPMILVKVYECEEVTSGI